MRIQDTFMIQHNEYLEHVFDFKFTRGVSYDVVIDQPDSFGWIQNRTRN